MREDNRPAAGLKASCRLLACALASVFGSLKRVERAASCCSSSSLSCVLDTRTDTFSRAFRFIAGPDALVDWSFGSMVNAAIVPFPCPHRQGTVLCRVLSRFERTNGSLKKRSSRTDGSFRTRSLLKQKGTPGNWKATLVQQTNKQRRKVFLLIIVTMNRFCLTFYFLIIYFFF